MIALNYFPPYFLLQQARSTKQQVVLTNLSLASGGTYKCEVSAEAPSFRTKFAKQDMVVVVLPTKAEIIGVQPKYQVGDTVNVTCYSYRYIHTYFNILILRDLKRLPLLFCVLFIPYFRLLVFGISVTLVA